MKMSPKNSKKHIYIHFDAPGAEKDPKFEKFEKLKLFVKSFKIEDGFEI